MDTLFASAPGFDQPIAVLKHCHDRIRKQLLTLEKLPIHLADYGADKEAQQAASAVLKYFHNAAPLHHADEEDDLLPALAATAQNEDAQLLKELQPKILAQHITMAAHWQLLESQLLSIADGSGEELSMDDVIQFQALYQEHMEIEETQIAPMALRILSKEQMQKMGAAMQERRGISN